MGEKIIIPHLGILVTTFCNLNCRNCADLIPKRERKHYDIKDIKRDLHQILEVVEFIEEVLVIGGETILYPDLIEVLSFCAQQPKIGKIIITTNGKTIPEEELLKYLKYYKVLVRISGYPEYVVPNRKEVVSKYKDYAIDIEDFEDMTWLSMGDTHKRKRSRDSLQRVFRSCSMKDCVTINSDGKIFYCSRQLSAAEIPIYPDPLENEYIDVRNTENLGESFKKFYSLPYISTCDYCDGISCETTRTVNTATQILDKAAFLDAIVAYELLKNDNVDLSTQKEALEIIYHILKDYPENLCDFKEAVELAEVLGSFANNHLENMYGLLTKRLKSLLDELTCDYNFSVSENVPYAIKRNIHNTPNMITIGMYPVDAEADIVLTENDILEALATKYPLDGIIYNKLFIESKLTRLKKEEITCIVSGLSYTQYGILESKMPFPTINLSVTGEDTPYSILMAEHALKLNPKVDYLIIPMTYYQGCYDMSDDDISLHKDVVSRINIPILKNARNYKGTIINPDGYNIGNPLKIYDMALDLNEARSQRDDAIRDSLAHMEYFNDMNPQNPSGSLKFTFQELTEDEKYTSAKITAEHNERVCTKKGYLEVKKYLKPFLDEMRENGKKLLFFVPPMTEYLYESYHKQLKDFYYSKIVTMLEHYDNVKFIDLAVESKTFLETDFCDFEHLNIQGAKKLTKIIGHTLKQF